MNETRTIRPDSIMLVISTDANLDEVTLRELTESVSKILQSHNLRVARVETRSSGTELIFYLVGTGIAIVLVAACEEIGRRIGASVGKDSSKTEVDEQSDNVKSDLRQSQLPESPDPQGSISLREAVNTLKAISNKLEDIPGGRKSFEVKWVRYDPDTREEHEIRIAHEIRKPSA